MTRMSPPCMFWRDRSSPERQPRTTDRVTPKRLPTEIPSRLGCLASPPKPRALLKSSLVCADFSSCPHGARHSLRVPQNTGLVKPKHRTRGSAWSWHLSLSCSLFGWVKVWLITVNHGYACCLKNCQRGDTKSLMLQPGEKKVLPDPQNAHTRSLEGTGLGHRSLQSSGTRCQFSRDFILTPLFFLVELLWAQTAGFHTALNLRVIK